MALYDILNLCQNHSKNKLVSERWHKYIEVARSGWVSMDSGKMLILPHLQWSSHDKKKVTFWKIYDIWIKPLGQVFSKEDDVWLDNTLQKKKHLSLITVNSPRSIYLNATLTPTLKRQNYKFFTTPLSRILRRDLSTKKTKPNIEKWPESLRVMLE